MNGGPGGVSSRGAGIDLDAGQGREPARHAGVQRRRAVGGDGCPALRPPRLHPRRAGVHRRLTRARPWRRFAAASARSASRTTTILLFSELMDSASLFLTANCDTVYFLGFVDLSDGPMVIDVPPLGAPSGILGTIDDMWFRLGHRLRPSRTRPRRGRPVPDRRARLRRAAARQRLPRLPRRTTRGSSCWAGRSWSTTTRASRSTRSATASGSRRTCPVRRGPRSATFLAGGAAPRRRRLRPRRPGSSKRSGMSFNTIPPNDYGFWEIVNELVQQEPRRRRRSRAARPARLGRDRQGQAVQARRADAQDPRGRGRRRQRDRPHLTFAPRPEEGFAYYPGSDWYQHALGRRLPVPRSAAADHAGRRRRRARATVRASSTRGSPSSTRRPASRRRCACASPASARSTSSPCATPTASTSTAGATTGSRSRRTSPRAASGRSCSTTARPARCSRPISPSRTRQPVGHRRDQPRRLDRHLLRADRARRARRTTGSRPCRARAGSTILRLYCPLPAVLRQDLAASEIEPI